MNFGPNSLMKATQSSIRSVSPPASGRRNPVAGLRSLLQKQTAKAAAIRQELLTGTGHDLQTRRKITALSAVGLVDFAVISLYQSGVIKKLPDPPLRIFASDKVNGSVDAYWMGAPDATISACVYAAGMVLATAGGSHASGRKPVWDVLLGATVAANAAGAIYYLFNMVFKQRKICPYCVAGAAVNITSAILAAPLALRATKRSSR